MFNVLNLFHVNPFVNFFLNNRNYFTKFLEVGLNFVHIRTAAAACIKSTKNKTE